MPRSTSRKGKGSCRYPKDGVEDGGELAFYLAEAKRHKVMTREEEQVLARKVLAGGNEGLWARNEFVKRNMRLVVTIARKYATEDLTLADLVQEGNIGLMRALEKFDPERGFKFSTYASWWVRQSVTRAIYNAGTIRLPPYVMTAKHQLAQVERRSDTPLTDAELSDYTGLSLDMLERIRTLPVALTVLDNPVGMGDEENVLLVDLTADPKTEDGPEVEHIVDRDQLKARIEQALEKVPERDREILLTWATEEDVSMEEIGVRVGLTRERVRQILLRIIRFLKQKVTA